MEYLHTMVRVTDLDAALDFYCAKLGLVETQRYESEQGRFTLVFLSAPGDVARAKDAQAPLVELTYNWDAEDLAGGRNFGHLAYRVDDIHATCAGLQEKGVTINRAAPRRPHGVHPLARRHLHRAPAEGQGAGAGGAVEEHAQHRLVVGPGPTVAVVGIRR